ncbi:MAG: glutathione S-transferase [Limimaricola sp.]|uniref:glutathione S-transferase n=1 Tax=Limimaricola sp. TaxID=2211665 RepID=UPI001D3E20A5|nr:glutathione S-transferase [Limimaricola sp.]MBI1417736.1 glutathione S-transferase [Limimaricola sp.]
MTYDLLIGDYAYSSWSLRGWLVFDAFAIPARVTVAQLYCDDFAAKLAGFPPARTVPVMRTPEGTVVPETLAIAEELASRHPQADIWPAAPAARAVARALAAEMHAGFGALREHCPMNLRQAFADCAPPAAVLADLDRLQTIWGWARAQTGATGPWLCGAYSAADAFFAPVAARIAGYSLLVDAAAQDYVAAHLAHPSFRRWFALAQTHGPDQPFYDRDWPRKPWPEPALSTR